METVEEDIEINQSKSILVFSEDENIENLSPEMKIFEFEYMEMFE